MTRHACGRCGAKYDSMQAALLCCDPDFDTNPDPPTEGYGEAPPADVPPERHAYDERVKRESTVDLRTDGGHHEDIEITDLPYQCRVCGHEQPVYVDVECLDGDRVADRHNLRLIRTYCDDCHAGRPFVLAVEGTDAARDEHPIQAVRDLEAKRQGKPLRADGGVVESDMEAWIAAGCPEPVAADQDVGDRDCDFECDHDAEYRVQFDNGHITLCCQPCSNRNRLYAKENDLLENEVHETNAADGGQR